jgi:hypothetical protein
MALGRMHDLFTGDFMRTRSFPLLGHRPIAFAPEGLHLGRGFTANMPD